MSIAPPAPARRSRFWLYLPFSLLLIFCLLWTGFWFYGRMKIGEVIDTAILRASERGQKLACPDRSIGGFPFRMEVVCRNASFSAEGPDGPVSASIGAVILNAKATDPTAVIAVLEGPVTLMTPFGAGKVMWEQARISLRASGLNLGAVDLVIKGLDVELPLPAGRAPVKARLAEFEGHIRQKPDTAIENRADFDVVAKAVGISSETMPVLKDAPPLDVEIQLTILRAPLRPTGPRPAMLDAWRDAGGSATIVLGKVNKGDITVEATGDLKLDAERRLEGRLNIAFNNLDQLVQPLALEVPGMMVPLLKNGKAPIKLSNGRAALGPIPVGVLNPLY